MVVPPVTPFLIVPITVRLAVDVCVAPLDDVDAPAPTLFLTTVEVLPSLDSLLLLTLRAVRDGALFADEAAVVAVAALLVLVAGGAAFEAAPAAELAIEDVVALRLVAATLVDRAFSTILLRMLLLLLLLLLLLPVPGLVLSLIHI